MARCMQESTGHVTWTVHDVTVYARVKGQESEIHATINPLVIHRVSDGSRQISLLAGRRWSLRRAAPRRWSSRPPVQAFLQSSEESEQRSPRGSARWAVVVSVGMNITGILTGHGGSRMIRAAGGVHVRADTRITIAIVQVFRRRGLQAQEQLFSMVQAFTVQQAVCWKLRIQDAAKAERFCRCAPRRRWSSRPLRSSATRR